MAGARRIAAGFLLGALLWALVGPPASPRTVTVSASCGTDCFAKYAAQAQSICGACTTAGTEEASTLPLHWSVPVDPYAYDVMNEAAWLINNNNGGNATESGYASGWWPYSNPNVFNYGLFAYGTGNNGSPPYAFASPNYLTAGATDQAYVGNSGKDTISYQNGSVFWNCPNCMPVVNTPRSNWAQAEIHAWDTDNAGSPQPCPGQTSCFPWMNNCSPGEQFTMSYWNGSGWAHWGNMLLFSPGSAYWANVQASWLWTNGGC